MINHTCLLDHHQRSHYVPIGLKNWARKVVQQPEGKVVQLPEGEVARQAKFFQPTQPIPSPNCDRSGQLYEMQDERKTSRSQEISVKNSFNQELSSSDRTGRLVETEEIQARSSENSKSLNVELTHDRTGRPVNDTVAAQDDPQVYHEVGTLNIDDEVLRERIEAGMDFKIPGLPHSIVKHAQSSSVRELIQKIENHTNRHALQQHLRQNQSFNLFSPESKQMIRYVVNMKLCEFTRDGTQNAVQSMFIILGHWHLLLHVRANLAKKEEVKIRNSSSIRWTFFQFLSTSSRKDDFKDIDMVRSWETVNIIRPTS